MNFGEDETGGNLKAQGQANMEGAAKFPIQVSVTSTMSVKKVCGLALS